MTEDAAMSKQAELLAKGFKRQATYDEPRLSEMADMYRELGFEVCLIPFEPDGISECSTCMEQQPERFKTIFTRQSNKD